MIKRLQLANFRSLGDDVELSLGPLTVPAGTNGSGKSNVVDAFQFLADCMHFGLEAAIGKRHGIRAVRRWSSGHPRNVRLSVEVAAAGVSGTYTFELTGDRSEEYRVKEEHLQVAGAGETHELLIRGGTWVAGPSGLRPHVDSLNLALPLVAGDERFRAFADVLRGFAVYTIFPDKLRQPQKYDPRKPMDGHGANWVSILKDQDEATWKPDLLTVLQRLSGDIVDIKVRRVSSYLEVQFEHAEPGSKREKVFDASQESDGTLRVAGILTALLQEPRPTLVAIEEPELTVHPGALEVIVDYVREATDRVQVVLTSHSPDLLQHVRPEEVRVVERRNGVTTVERLDAGQVRVVQSQLLGLGDVLRREGLQQQTALDFGAED